MGCDGYRATLWHHQGGIIVLSFLYLLRSHPIDPKVACIQRVKKLSTCFDFSLRLDCCDITNENFDMRQVINLEPTYVARSRSLDHSIM